MTKAEARRYVYKHVSDLVANARGYDVYFLEGRNSEDTFTPSDHKRVNEAFQELVEMLRTKSKHK